MSAMLFVRLTFGIHIFVSTLLLLQSGAAELNGTKPNAPLGFNSHITTANLTPPFNTVEAKQCYQSWVDSNVQPSYPDWRLCYPFKTLSDSDYVPFSGTSILKTIRRIGLGSTYTTCDGIPRFAFSPGASITTSSSFVTVVHHGWRLGQWTENCTSSASAAARPSCEVPKAFCNDIWATYRSRVRTFSTTELSQTIPSRPSYPCGASRECFLDLQYHVALLYWPPKLVSRNICADNGFGYGETVPPLAQSLVTTVTAISFPGRDLYRQSWVMDGRTVLWEDRTSEPYVMKGTWVLTSPSVYMAYRSVTAFEVFRRDGNIDTLPSTTIRTVLAEGMVSMRSVDVYSKRPLNIQTRGGPEEARTIATGLWRPKPGQMRADSTIAYEIRPFNFEHLQNPVPASVYMDARPDCWGQQTHCATITDDTYEYRLHIPKNIWRPVFSDHYDCEIPEELDLIDPPIALTPVSNDDPDMKSRPAPAGLVSATTTPLTKEETFAYRSGPLANPARPPHYFFDRPGPRQTSAPRPGKSGKGSSSGGYKDQTDVWSQESPNSRKQGYRSSRGQGQNAAGNREREDYGEPGATEAEARTRQWKGGYQGRVGDTKFKNGQSCNVYWRFGYMLSFAVMASTHL